MARVVGYTVPRWEIEDAGGNLDDISVGSGVEGAGVGVLWPWEAVRLDAADDGALFFW